MTQLEDALRTLIAPLGWLSALLGLGTPVWFLVAALGTKWGFFDWSFGLDWMTQDIGRRLLFACLVAGGVEAAAIAAHRFVAGRFKGVVMSPVIAVLCGAIGMGWMLYVDNVRRDTPAILDVTTDTTDVPNFTPAFAMRRDPSDLSLAYDGKLTLDGEPMAEAQAEAYPSLGSVQIAAAPDVVFRRAMDYAREEGWRINTASESAGMFEAGAESLWFGFRDDIVVRVRALEDGGSQVDIRSLARQPVHDLGRNADRVHAFLAAMSDARGPGR